MARTPSPPDPVIISWSGLKRWENCPQHQLRVIKKEAKKSEMGRIFLPGTVCDLAQRRWLESDNPQPGEMEQMVEEILSETVDKAEHTIHWKGNPVTDREEVGNYCRETVKALEPWLIKNVLPYEYEPEVRFRAHMEIPYICGDARAPLRMIGGIDIVVRDDQGKFRLYDLKTTKDPSYLRTTLGQLTFYDLAWGVIQGDFNHAVDWGFVVPALPEMLIPVTVDHEDRRVMMSRIVKYAQGVWRDEWDPKSDDTGCQWCEAKEVCEKFKTVPIIEENGKQKISFAQTVARRSKFRNNADTFTEVESQNRM